MTARNQLGFSLIEVMCAILILGIALVGLTQGITTALSSSKESEVQTMAALFAAGQIETLRAEGELIDGVTESDSSTASLYRWKQTVTKANIDGLHEVDVLVESAKTGKEIYDLKTMLFEPPSSTASDETTPKASSSKSKKKRRER